LAVRPLLGKDRIGRGADVLFQRGIEFFARARRGV